MDRILVTILDEHGAAIMSLEVCDDNDVAALREYVEGHGHRLIED